MCTLVPFGCFPINVNKLRLYCALFTFAVRCCLNVIPSVSNVTLPPSNGTTHVDLPMTAFYSQVIE